LGSQQQIAGGGTYPEGCGWAIGVDRVVIAAGRTMVG
jgi:elongation factor P--beta-lysine ligase